MTYEHPDPLRWHRGWGGYDRNMKDGWPISPEITYWRVPHRVLVQWAHNGWFTTRQKCMQRLFTVLADWSWV